jgi:GNAT superfamily N-acetyltransferase
MIDIDRYRPDDRHALDALYRRVLGDERAEALERRWEWLYLHNPNLPGGSPLIWLARDGTAIVGQYATMPVRLWVNGGEIDAAWGTDVMVAPEGQRQGLGNRLFDTWDQNVGASIGLGLTDASHGLFKKLQWPDLGRVPRFVKPIGGTVGRLVATLLPLGGVVRRVHHFDERFTRLWERVAPRFAFAVRRDAPYLEWRYVQTPHLRYSIAALVRRGEAAGYVVYRHVDEPGRRITALVDFLADPADPRAMRCLLRWVEREAVAAGSSLIRVFATNIAFQDTLRTSGYHTGKPGMRFVAKINAVPVPPTFYDSFEQWHVTLGDSDVDR